MKNYAEWVKLWRAAMVPIRLADRKKKNELRRFFRGGQWTPEQIQQMKDLKKPHLGDPPPPRLPGDGE